MALVFAGWWLLVLVTGARLDGRQAVAVLGVAIVVLAIGECLYDSVQGPLVAGLAPDGSTGRYLAVSGFGWQGGFILAPASAGLCSAPRRSPSRRSACACASPGQWGRCGSSGRCPRRCASRRRLARWRRSGSSARVRWGAPSAARCCAAARGWSRRSPDGASARRGWRGEAGLELLPSVGEVVAAADVVLSIVPPDQAEAVAAELGGASLFADLNAVSPETARRISSEVDGSISGPPPGRAGATRIYLSGPRAGDVAALPFDGVEVIVVGDEVGLASAVKMSTASVYKGSAALLAQALRAADHYGVLGYVLDDLDELAAGAGRRIARAAAKADRYVGEMREISAAQRAVGLDPALFEAIARVYAEIASTPLGQTAPEQAGSDLAEVLRGLRRCP